MLNLHHRDAIVIWNTNLVIDDLRKALDSTSKRIGGTGNASINHSQQQTLKKLYLALEPFSFHHHCI